MTITKISNDERIYKPAYFSSKAKTITNENELNKELQTSKQEILNGIAVWISEASG